MITFLRPKHVSKLNIHSELNFTLVKEYSQSYIKINYKRKTLFQLCSYKYLCCLMNEELIRHRKVVKLMSKEVYHKIKANIKPLLFYIDESSNSEVCLRNLDGMSLADGAAVL